MNRRTSEWKIGSALLIVMLALMSLVYTGASQVPSGQETTLFSDNFDKYPVGSFPSAGGGRSCGAARART